MVKKQEIKLNYAEAAYVQKALSLHLFCKECREANRLLAGKIKQKESGGEDCKK